MITPLVRHLWQLIRSQLIIQVIIAITLGVIVGLTFPETAKQLQIISAIFIKLIKLVIVPLIFVSLILGICQHRHDKGIGKLAIITIIYLEVISTIAILIAFAIMLYLEPGAGFNTQTVQHNDVSHYFTTTTTETNLPSFIMNIIPDSIVGVLAEHNLLAVIFLAVVMSVAILRAKEAAAPILTLLTSVNKILFNLIAMVAAISPLAAFGAIAAAIGQHGLSALLPLGYLILCIVLAMVLFIGFMFFMAHWYSFSAWQLMKYIKNELLIAFSTSSSEAVFPQLLMKLEHFGCSKSVVSFVLPMGYSFNLAGTGIYVIAGALFIQQAYGISFGLYEYALLLGIILVTSKGAAGVTGAGFVTLAATLSALPGHMIPLEGLALLLGIDRFMSDLRTMSNVVGNALATVMIAKSCGEFHPPTQLKESI